MHTYMQCLQLGDLDGAIDLYQKAIEIVEAQGPDMVRNVYMYVCMYVCMYSPDMVRSVCMCVYICVGMLNYLDGAIESYLKYFIHTYITHTCVHVYMHACIHVYMNTRIIEEYEFLHTKLACVNKYKVHTYIHKNSGSPHHAFDAQPLVRHVCTRIYIHTHTYAHTCAISQVPPIMLSTLNHLLGTALAALPPHRCADAPCAEHAANKFRLALK